MSEKVYEFSAVIEIPKDGVGAYVVFPYDAFKEFGKRRVKVRATFDGELYDGLVCKMGVFDENGEGVYLIVVPKAIRQKINKSGDDEISVTIKERFGEREYLC